VISPKLGLFHNDIANENGLDRRKRVRIQVFFYDEKSGMSIALSNPV
jgi:hypothetical protein